MFFIGSYIVYWDFYQRVYYDKKIKNIIYFDSQKPLFLIDGIAHVCILENFDISKEWIETNCLIEGVIFVLLYTQKYIYDKGQKLRELAALFAECAINFNTPDTILDSYLDINIIEERTLHSRFEPWIKEINSTNKIYKYKLFSITDKDTKKTFKFHLNTFLNIVFYGWYIKKITRGYTEFATYFQNKSPSHPYFAWKILESITVSKIAGMKELI